MDLSDHRSEIDRIDRQLAGLIAERMAVAEAIAGYKAEHGLPVLDADRERAHLEEILRDAPPALEPAYRRLFTCLMEVSREHQQKVIQK